MKYLFIIALVFSANLIHAQSNTTQKLHEKYDNAFYLFFYENTLKMMNQTGDKQFEKLVDNIEKMKFLRLDKAKENISRDEVKELFNDYREEAFEEIMTMRSDGADIKVMIQERDKITTGLVMLINDPENLAILDIKGSVPLEEIASLYDKVKMINR